MVGKTLPRYIPGSRGLVVLRTSRGNEDGLYATVVSNVSNQNDLRTRAEKASVRLRAIETVGVDFRPNPETSFLYGAPRIYVHAFSVACDETFDRTGLLILKDILDGARRHLPED